MGATEDCVSSAERVPLIPETDHVDVNDVHHRDVSDDEVSLAPSLDSRELVKTGSAPGSKPREQHTVQSGESIASTPSFEKVPAALEARLPDGDHPDASKLWTKAPLGDASSKTRRVAGVSLHGADCLLPARTTTVCYTFFNWPSGTHINCSQFSRLAMPSPTQKRIAVIALAAAIALICVTSLTYAAKPTKCSVDDDEPPTSAIGPVGRSSGCGKAPFDGTIFNVTVNSTQRQYYVRVPVNYDPSRAYGVLFAFHWHDGDMLDVVNKFFFYGMVLYHNESTILIAPQGIDDAWENNGGEDIELVRQILKHVESSLCVDTSKRFAMGFSYGASMAHSVACSLGKDFRAVAVQSGGEYSGCEGNGTTPVAYMIAHGIRDTIIPIEKGRALRDVFVKANGCRPQTPPEPAIGDLNHIKTSYEGCSSGYPVDWYAFDDAHTAMPSDGSLMQNKTTTWEPEATWKFFAQFM